MARKKPNVRAQIIEGKNALKALMQEHLAGISDAMIEQIAGRADRLIDSKALDAIKDVATPGMVAYKQLLVTALAVISSDALTQVRKEVPKAKNVKLAGDGESIELAEFDDLPPALKKKVKAQADLIVSAQVGDLEKNVKFQYLNSVDSTDSIDLIKKDMSEAAEDYITGSAIESGAGKAAADMIASARQAFFDDPEVSEQVEALQFVNGDPVTEICTALDGRIFAKDDPEAFRYTPPLHWNCKSYVIPILNGNLRGREIESLKVAPSLEKQIKFSECGCEKHAEPKPRRTRKKQIYPV